MLHGIFIDILFLQHPQCIVTGYALQHLRGPLRTDPTKSSLGSQDIHTTVTIFGVGVKHTAGDLYQLTDVTDKQNALKPQLSAQIQRVTDKIGRLNSDIRVDFHPGVNST